MSRNVKKHKSFTKDKKYPPKTQKIKSESDIAKQELVEPTDSALPTYDNGTENDISVFIPEDNWDHLSLKLPENERAVDDGGVAKNENRIWKEMKLSPIWKMGQIRNVLNDSLFAQIFEDKNGIRTVNFCQRYQNGGFSAKMAVLQSDLIMAALYTPQSDKAGNLNAGIRKRISKFKSNMYDEYLGKFQGTPQDAFDIGEILNVLCKTLSQLPVWSDDRAEQRRRELYREITERVSTYLTQTMNPIQGYYALTEEDMTYLAQELRRDKLSLLREMRDYGFLYIQSSASGFQSNIRLTRADGTSYTEWRYCIYRLNYFTKDKKNPDDDDDLEPFDF